MSIADAVRESVNAIFRLHAALNNILTHSDPILDALRKSRKTLHEEFEGYIAFLEDSLSYAREYVKLCESTDATADSLLVFA